MKSWLIFFIPPLFLILIFVLIQLQLTRNAMTEFAKKHNFTYKKPKFGAFFNTGGIHGSTNNVTFFMGMLSTNYGFGPVAEIDYADEKFLYMKINVNSMPNRLVISKREEGRFGKIIDKFSIMTGIPLIKTGDEAFDSKIKVIGYEKEVLPWLTEQRRKVIIDFLSKKNCVITQNGVACTLSKTRLSLKDLEETYTHLITTQVKL